jgi:hypothetical protein
MSLLRRRAGTGPFMSKSLGMRRSARVDLRLEPGLDHVQGTCHDTGQTSCAGAREKLELPADIPGILPLPGPFLALLVKHKLEGGEREVAVKGRLVAVEEGAEAFVTDDGPDRIPGAAVVVAGFEVGVVVPALKLEACF